ncbi:hypothetical protein HDU76_004878 [Blyttiomyces sp. JEL0837]|nr:hypothetical protein HDU76_004878 [Blyttiomyces sp. JEL0837]
MERATSAKDYVAEKASETIETPTHTISSVAHCAAERLGSVTGFAFGIVSEAGEKIQQTATGVVSGAGTIAEKAVSSVGHLFSSYEDWVEESAVEDRLDSRHNEPDTEPGFHFHKASEMLTRHLEKLNEIAGFHHLKKVMRFLFKEPSNTVSAVTDSTNKDYADVRVAEQKAKISLMNATDALADFVKKARATFSLELHQKKHQAEPNTASTTTAHAASLPVSDNVELASKCLIEYLDKARVMVGLLHAEAQKEHREPVHSNDSEKSILKAAKRIVNDAEQLARNAVFNATEAMANYVGKLEAVVAEPCHGDSVSMEEVEGAMPKEEAKEE